MLSGSRVVPIRTTTSRPSVNGSSHPSVNGSSRPSANADTENNNLPASIKASIIRLICNQISQGMYEASDSLNDEKLHELGLEIATYSTDAIKRMINPKPSNEGDDIMSTDGRSLRFAINERMADVVEKTVNSPTMGLVHEDRQYDAFLNICCSSLLTNQQQLRRDFIAFKRSDINIPFLCISLLAAIFSQSTGLNFSSDVSVFQHYPTLLPTLLFAVLTTFSFLWVFFNRLVFLSYRYNITCLQRFHKYVIQFYDSPYGQLSDNLAVVCAAIGTGFSLVNIVVMDLCDPNKLANVGTSHPHACYAFVEPPTEWYMLTMFGILVLQFFARGVSRIALVCSWIICFVSINTSIYLSDSGNYIWMNLLQLLIIFISYELERLPLRMYLKTLKAIEASEITAKLKMRLASYEKLQAAEALKAKCSLVRMQSIYISY